MTAAGLMETFRWAVCFGVAGAAAILLVASGACMRSYLRDRNDPAIAFEQLQADQDAYRAGAIVGALLIVIAILVRP